MTTKEFSGFVCWTSDNINETAIPDLGVLSSEDDLLLKALEVPLPLNDLLNGAVTIGIDDIANRIVEGLDKSPENYVVAVRGKSGSGKTFVIKKLFTLLPKRDDIVVIYVSRSDVSMRRVVELVVRNLPGSRAQEVREQLERATSDKSDSELGEDVILQISQRLRRGIAPQEGDDESVVTALLGKKVEDDDGVIRHEGGLGDLLREPDFIKHLNRDSGPLKTLVRFSHREFKPEQRELETSEFNASDIDLDVIQEITDSKDVCRALATVLGTKGYKQIALSLLNRCLPEAIARVGGVSISLNEVLDDARVELGKEGKRLVLFFEDIALAGGQGPHLYDAMRSYPRGAPPLTVIFAATDGFDIPNQIQNLLSGSFEVPLLDVATPEGTKFADEAFARLMNLARVGKVVVLEQLRDSSDRTVVSHCDSCDFRTECHQEFGAAEGYGLYPLNPFALHEMLRFDQANPGVFSPRNLVELVRKQGGVIRSAIDDIRDGSHPTSRTFDIVYPRERTRENLLDLAEDKNDAESERVFHARAIYTGKSQHSETLAKAFSLGVSGTTRTDIPPKSADEGGTRVDRRIWTDQNITDWANNRGERITAANAQSIRRTLQNLVKETLLLGDHFLHKRPNAIVGSGDSPALSERIDELTRPQVFLIDGADGREIQGSFQKTFEWSRENAQLFQAALWFGRFEQWESKEENGVTHVPSEVVQRGRAILESRVDEIAHEIRNILLRDVATEVRSNLAHAVDVHTLLNPDIIHLSPEDILIDVLNVEVDSSRQFVNPTMNQKFADMHAEASLNAITSWPNSRQGSGAIQAVDFVELRRICSGVLEDQSSWQDRWDIALKNLVNDIIDELRVTSTQLKEVIVANPWLTSGRESDVEEIQDVLEKFVNLRLPFRLTTREMSIQVESFLSVDFDQVGSFFAIVERADLDVSEAVELWKLGIKFPDLTTWLSNFVNVSNLLAEMIECVSKAIRDKLLIDEGALVKRTTDCLDELGHLQSREESE